MEKVLRMKSNEFKLTEKLAKVVGQTEIILPCRVCSSAMVFPPLTIFSYTCEVCCAACNNESRRSERPRSWTDCIVSMFWNLEKERGAAMVSIRKDLCPFMDRHWTQVCHPERVKTTTWENTVISQISTHCSVFSSFENGSGLWSLRRADSSLISSISAHYINPSNFI